MPKIIGIICKITPIINAGLERSKKNKFPAKEPLFGELLIYYIVETITVHRMNPKTDSKPDINLESKSI